MNATQHLEILNAIIDKDDAGFNEAYADAKPESFISTVYLFEAMKCSNSFAVKLLLLRNPDLIKAANSQLIGLIKCSYKNGISTISDTHLEESTHSSSINTHYPFY